MSALLNVWKTKLKNAIDASNSLDELANLDISDLLSGGVSKAAPAGASVTTAAAESASSTGKPPVRRPRIIRRIDHKVTSHERQMILGTLGKLDPSSPEYQDQRDRACLHFKLTPKQVSSVVANSKNWAKRKKEAKKKAKVSSEKKK